MGESGGNFAGLNSSPRRKGAMKIFLGQWKEAFGEVPTDFFVANG